MAGLFRRAAWEGITRGPGEPDFLPIALNPREGMRGRSLEVTTTHLRPGYLRKNGVPYSARTTLKEYFDVRTERNGDTWFVVTTIVEDPEYLDHAVRHDAPISRSSPTPPAGIPRRARLASARRAQVGR